MRDKRDTVLPVPEGISRTQWPPASNVPIEKVSISIPELVCLVYTFEVAHIASIDIVISRQFLWKTHIKRTYAYCSIEQYQSALIKLIKSSVFTWIYPRIWEKNREISASRQIRLIIVYAYIFLLNIKLHLVVVAGHSEPL
jgi:hypothetical protein